jgi:hypothetical protein
MRRNLLIVLISTIFLCTFYYSINEARLLRIEIQDLERLVEEQNRYINNLKLSNEEITKSIENDDINNKNNYDKLVKQVQEHGKSIKCFSEYQQFRCYIKSGDIETGELIIDRIEWLSIKDKERREELGLGDEIGYLYNEIEESIKYYIDNDTILEILKDASIKVEVNIKEFQKKIGLEYTQVYEITIVNGKVVKISECYLP